MMDQETRSKNNRVQMMDGHHKVGANEENSPQLDETENVQVGSRIRAIRKQRGQTIRNLAEECQVSPNTISLIENERTSPSIRTLCQIANGLGVSVSTLVEPEHPGSGVVHQKQGQRAITQFANGTIENLGEGLPPLGAEPILVTLETHGTRVEDASHAGREFVYCLDGKVDCVIAGTEYSLSVGDSLLFDASVPHHWENMRPQPSRLLVLFCPIDAHDQPVEQHLGH